MRAAQVVSSLLFVVLLGVVLTIPIRSSDRPSDLVAGLPRPSPSVTTPKGRPLIARGKAGLLERLPGQCRRWQLQPPTGGGIIAAARAGRVSFARPDGTAVARLNAFAPVGWSKSGRYLATGPAGNLWTSDGLPIERHGQYQIAFGGDSGWAWSPVADCGFSLDRRGNLFVTVVNPSKIPPAWGVTLARGVESFALSSDWRWIGLVLQNPGWRSLAIADLQRHRLHIIKTYPRATCCITLAGWSASGQNLYFWAGPGVSVMTDGWELQAASAPSGPLQRVHETVLPQPSLVSECAGAAAVIAGGGRDRRTNKRVRYIEGSNVALTSRELAVSSFTCSPGSQLVFSAAPDGEDPGGRKLYLLDLAGSGGLDVLADDPKRADDRPEWSPGTGVLFVRWSGRRGELWLLPEGGYPYPLPLSVRTDEGAYWSGANWDRVIDWSATPPRGLP